MKVVTDLIASVQPISNRTEKQKRIALAPDIVKRLRRGLDSISFNPFEVSERIQELENIHMALIQGERFDEQHAEFSPDVTPEPEEAGADSQLVMEKDDPFMIAVAAFMPGAWFDLNDGLETKRCRLAAIIKATGKYIFVNRAGTKVAEHSQLDLALKFKNSEIKPVDNGSLFDRALENVVSNMRETKSKNKMDLDNPSNSSK